MEKTHQMSVQTFESEAKVAYGIFYWQGVGNLFPWNAFITAAGYFTIRFCGASFEDTFENYFTIAYMISQTVGLILCVKYQNLFRLNPRFVIPLVLFSLVMVLATILVAIEDMSSDLLFGITIFSIFVCGGAGSVLSGALYGLAGQFPQKNTQAIMAGQGLAGIIASMTSLVTVWAGSPQDLCDDDDAADDDDSCDNYSIDYSSLTYFIVSSIVVVSCIGSYLYLRGMSITEHYMTHGSFPEDQSDRNPLVNGSDLTEPFADLENYDEDGDKKVHDPLEVDDVPLLENADGKTSRVPSDASPIHLVHIPSDERTSSMQRRLSEAETLVASRAPSVAEISGEFKQMLIPIYSVWLTFSITIGCFPSLTAHITSTNSCSSSDDERFYNDLFVPFMFILFNVFDFAGRSLAGAVQIFNKDNIWIPATCRLIFIPLFLFCHVKNSDLPILFHNDAFPILIMILFSLSNGYIASLSMMFGPSMFVSPDQKQRAGTLMALMLTLGLCTGSILSLPIVYLSLGSL
jgi:equilibrative nucleoside transporter 1/2/3